MDSAQAAARGRIGGLARSLRLTPDENTRPKRDAFLQGFYDQVDRDYPGVDPDERERKARVLLRLHMARLSVLGVAARKAKAAQS
jgi:hypothetical protein